MYINRVYVRGSDVLKDDQKITTITNKFTKEFFFYNMYCVFLKKKHFIYSAVKAFIAKIVNKRDACALTVSNFFLFSVAQSHFICM